jgi:hypothetical protein
MDCRGFFIHAASPAIASWRTEFRDLQHSKISKFQRSSIHQSSSTSLMSRRAQNDLFSAMSGPHPG